MVLDSPKFGPAQENTFLKIFNKFTRRTCEMKFRVIIAALVAVILLPLLAAGGEVTFIGNPSLTVSKLSKKDVRNIFLGKKTTWDDNTKIVFVIQEDTPTHEAFLEKYLRKSPSQFKRYWKDKVFTGKGSLPQAFASEQNLIKFVSETKGALGYVSAGTNLNEVKTISVK